MKKLIKIINNIVNRSTKLKNRFTDAHTAPIEFVCIFCQNDSWSFEISKNP